MSISNSDKNKFNSIENNYLEPNDEEIVYCLCHHCHEDIMMNERILVTGESFEIHEDCFNDYFMEECYYKIAGED